MAHTRAYIEAVGRIYTRSCGKKHVVYKSAPSLTNPRLLAKYLNNPQNRYQSIHVTGSVIILTVATRYNVLQRVDGILM